MRSCGEHFDRHPGQPSEARVDPGSIEWRGRAQGARDIVQLRQHENRAALFDRKANGSRLWLRFAGRDDGRGFPGSYGPNNKIKETGWPRPADFSNVGNPEGFQVTTGVGL